MCTLMTVVSTARTQNCKCNSRKLKVHS